VHYIQRTLTGLAGRLNCSKPRCSVTR
jgi:hypothetical protein